MDSYILSNNVRLGVSQALLLLYRYLTGIYVLGDLASIQFLGGFLRGSHRGLDNGYVLTVSGNGIGELEKLLCLQWKTDLLDTMAVDSSHMRIMRMLVDSAPDEFEKFFDWARDSLMEYPNLQMLLDSPGLVAYWQQEAQLWQSKELKNRIRLFGGSPWDMPVETSYDAIILSHAQNLLRDSDAKQLLSYLKPGGLLVAMMPVVFRPDSFHQQMPVRFSDSPPVQSAMERMRVEASRLGYEISDDCPKHIRWAFEEKETVSHVVSFSIASPLRSILIGELLIQTLEAELQDDVRLTLLESAIADISPTVGAGTEALLILIKERGDF